MTVDKFTCWKCQKTFPKAWSDQDVEKEYTQLYGPHMGEERELLCDVCQKDFMIWFEKQGHKYGS